MAQVSNLAHKLQIPNFPSPTGLNSKSSALPAYSVFFASKDVKSSSNCLRVSSKDSSFAAKNRSVKVMASVATAEKPSTAPEIVLQPIKDISGIVKLPGSKSLSNRILLLAALSEVILYVYIKIWSFDLSVKYEAICRFYAVAFYFTLEGYLIKH